MKSVHGAEVFALVALFAGGWDGGHPGCELHRDSWSQWAGGAAHDGQISARAQPVTRQLAQVVIDPFTTQELAENGAILAHYQVPLIDEDDVFVLQKSGQYTSCNPPGSFMPYPCGPNALNSQSWNERAMRWKDGRLVNRWTFASDWKPAPNPWEPMFQPALAGAFLYVPGAGGTVFKVARQSGSPIARLNPFGDAVDAGKFLLGGITVDDQKNIYYNTVGLDAATGLATGAWLVKVTAAGQITRRDLTTLIPDAPAPDSPCYLSFSFATDNPPLPWPPAPHSDGSPTLPPQASCGVQRPPSNATPAIGPDGTIFAVTRADQASTYSYLVALTPDLELRWARSLRDRLGDGCGTLVPYGPGPLDCRAGTPPGLDPFTNLPPAGEASDLATSAPTALPDGGVVFGTVTNYGGFRGHLMKFDGDGAFAGSFTFGWDITPAVYRHDGTYSLIIKDNHYLEQGPYFITQLSPALNIEWQFRATNPQTCDRAADGTVTCSDDGTHPRGFEWCISAPAVDSDGTVHVTSEDGNFYAIGQGGVERSRFFLSRTLGAAYTPIAVDGHGRVYAMNDGDLFVLGK